MDVEMPVMDGISAVRRIMSSRPTPVLMLSSLTHQGARATLDALEAGALDFLPKQFEEMGRDRQEGQEQLRARVLALARRRRASAVRSEALRPAVNASPLGTTVHVPRASPAAAPAVRGGVGRGAYQVVAIGTSTGGPVALQQILTALPASFPVPLLLIQHMPASFTPAFADRLNNLCAITVRQALDGDLLAAGTAYLAPGGRQMIVEARGGHIRIRVVDGDERLNYRPCIDVTFASVAKTYPGKVLAVVLTGMGADGREGARLLKRDGSSVWAQDEASCVIYGMPMAVVEAGLADRVLPLNQIGASLAEGL